MDRRTFIKGSLAGAGALAAGRAEAATSFVNLALPAASVPERRIDHLVVLMMENRSVDHLLGWYGAESQDRRESQRFHAVQHRTYPDLRTASRSDTVDTMHWPDHQGCGSPDPAHNWGTRHRVYTVRASNGESAGWLHPGVGNDEFCLSYYDAVDVPVTAYLVRRFAALDHYFTSVMGPTYPNRLYLHSGQSGGLKSNFFPFEVDDSPAGNGHGQERWRLGYTWPTIWDVLDARGITWRYHYSNLPTIGLFGAEPIARSGHISEFFADAAAGALPSVTFIDPYFVEPQGLANDDHPHADIRLGQQFVADVVRTLAESPQWPSTALVITYDEWGGFWDHLTPTRVPGDPRASSTLDDDFSLLGWRVPTMVVSPWVRRGAVDHTRCDHTSVLRFIYENWRIPETSQLHRLKSAQPEDNPGGKPGARVALPSIGSTLTRETPDLEVDLDALSYTAPPDARLRCERKEASAVSVSELFRAEPWLNELGWRTDFSFVDGFASSLELGSLLR